MIGFTSTLERDRKSWGIRVCKVAWIFGMTGRLLPPADSSNEDADLQECLASLGPGAIADLKRVLEAPQTYRDALLRQFIARPELADLAP